MAVRLDAMQESIVRPLSLIVAFMIAGSLAACNNSPCTDSSVLTKVKELYEKQQWGQFIQAPSNIFALQGKSATQVSTEKDSTTLRCSVLITTDLVELLRFTQHATEDEIAKVRAEGPKKGFALTKDELINFTVQPMGNGQNYVTVLP